MSIVEALAEPSAPAVNVDMNEEGTRLVVTFPYSMEDVKRIKFNADRDTGVPGARFIPPDKGGPSWELPRDMTSARRLREAFGDRLVLSPKVVKWGKAAREREEKLTELSEAGDATLTNLARFHPKLHDWMRDYQRSGAAMMATTSCINADEPGLGKTIQTIAAILEVAPQGKHLIVAPKTSLDTVWVPHFEKWTDIPYLSISGADSQAERREMIELMMEWDAEDQPFVVITNPAMVAFEKDESVPRDEWPLERGKPVQPLIPKYDEFFEIEWDTLVFDEYHKMGLANNKTQTFKSANSLKADHKLLLSGTPMGGKPVKLWGALHFLDPASFTSKWRWVDLWLDVEKEEVYTKNGKQEVRKIHGVKAGREDAFWNHLKPWMVRRKKEEVVAELPPKQYIEVWAEMTPAQKKQYEKFAADAELKIEEENLTATGILAEYMRLKQFSDARQQVKAMGNGELKVLPTTDSGKLPHLLEILEERGILSKKSKKSKEDVDEGDEQVVVFSQFSSVVDMIHKWLTEEHGIACAKITGAVTQKHRTELVSEFQNEKSIRVMVVSTTAGGVALTLDNANTVVIMDETWDPDDQTQAEDRVHRISRIHQVMVYYIRSKDSIESRIRALVQGKAITNREILDLRRQGLRAI